VAKRRLTTRSTARVPKPNFDGYTAAIARHRGRARAKTLAGWRRRHLRAASARLLPACEPLFRLTDELSCGLATTVRRRDRAAPDAALAVSAADFVTRILVGRSVAASPSVSIFISVSITLPEYLAAQGAKLDCVDIVPRFEDQDAGSLRPGPRGAAAGQPRAGFSAILLRQRRGGPWRRAGELGYSTANLRLDPAAA
jgi:hypothetical protein